MSNKKFIGSALAAAAALAFITAPLVTTVASAATAKVKCYGVNACKGKSACKTAKNDCKGKNSCKGQGLMMKSEKRCKKMGGSETEPTS